MNGHNFLEKLGFLTSYERERGRCYVFLSRSRLETPTETDDETRSTEHEIGVIDLRLSWLFDRINLQAAIEQLPEGYQVMFLLHDVHGYDHNTIAKMRGCSVGNSKSQLHKARKRLREELRDRDSGSE